MGKILHKIISRSDQTVDRTPGGFGVDTRPPGSVAPIYQEPTLDVNVFQVEYTHEGGVFEDYTIKTFPYAKIHEVLTPLLAGAVKDSIITKEVADKLTSSVSQIFSPHPKAPGIGLVKIPDEPRQVIVDTIALTKDKTPDDLEIAIFKKKRGLAAIYGITE